MFRTIVNIEPAAEKISYQDQIMTLGSCFSDNIGAKLQNAYFQVNVNPFGVLFNPLSIIQNIDFMLEGKSFDENDVFNQGSLWHSFNHSSLYSGITAPKTLELINDSHIQAMEALDKAKFILITFGTAWVYELKETKQVVANCHKLPAARFDRRRLSVDDIVTAYSVLLPRLKAQNPDLQLIFSVSPIRHWKDGVHENNLSKSILHLAIESLQKEFPFVDYFPAYEIQLDELRDYRFFASDMFHPSQLAVDYIWQRFTETYFDQNTRQLLKRLEKYTSQKAHRPIHVESVEYAKFKDNTEKEKERLLTAFPFLKTRL